MPFKSNPVHEVNPMKYLSAGIFSGGGGLWHENVIAPTIVKVRLLMEVSILSKRMTLY